MIDLETKSGLPIKLDKNKQLMFSNKVNPVKVDIRTYSQIREVLMQPYYSSKKTKFYFMYRNICLKEHQATIANNGLRYDITVIPGIKIGKEFNKTAGHFHALVPKTNLTYTEVYEVLQGECHYLLQKRDGSEFIIIKAKAGDKVVVPPNYAHVSVNPTNQVLVSANWMALASKSNYSSIKNKKGLMYYYTDEGFIKNKNFKNHPEPKEAKPENISEFGLTKKPMYFTALDKLDFLKQPQNHLEIFKKLYKL
ncbi:glucose-6-phosphate isomerase family protein [Nanoarchaeota archaeon]